MTLIWWFPPTVLVYNDFVMGVVIGIDKRTLLAKIDIKKVSKKLKNNV